MFKASGFLALPSSPLHPLRILPQTSDPSPIDIKGESVQTSPIGRLSFQSPPPPLSSSLLTSLILQPFLLYSYHLPAPSKSSVGSLLFLSQSSHQPVEVCDPDARQLVELLDGADTDRLLAVFAYPDGNWCAPVPVA